MGGGPPSSSSGCWQQVLRQVVGEVLGEVLEEALLWRGRGGLQPVCRIAL